MNRHLPSTLFVQPALIFVLLIAGCPCTEPLGGQGKPVIEFTFVPAIGSTDDLRGTVAHVCPGDHRVAVYTFVNGGWNTKPTFAQPVTPVSSTGGWVCDMTTGGVDALATRIAAFLIPATYSPPLQDGSSFELPAELAEHALDSVETTRPPTGPCVEHTCALPSGPQNALLTCRNWITFAPPRPFDPDRGTFPTEAELRAALQLLHCEGWRGLVTYSLDGTLSQVPRIAKDVGFDSVIAGLFWFDEAQLNRERAAALQEVAFIDGFVLGNEGLTFGRYTRQRLETEMASLQAETQRLIATTEPAQSYLDDATLLQLGDWVFPNVHPWFANIRTVPEAVQFVQLQVAQLEALAPGRPLVVKEAWWPTSGGSGANQQNQARFFLQLSQTTVKFVYGEAFDQYHKTQEGAQGPHWGFHNDTGAPKQVIEDVGEQYRSSYPK